LKTICLKELIQYYQANPMPKEAEEGWNKKRRNIMKI